MAFQGWVTYVDYLEFDADPSGTAPARPNLGMADGKPYLKALGQPLNTVAGNVANQPVGTLAVPALTAATVATIALTNTLITANSFIFLNVRRVGADTATGRGPQAWVDVQAAGSATIGVRSTVAAAVSLYVVHYLIIN